MSWVNKVMLDYVHQSFSDIQANNVWIWDNLILIIPALIIIWIILYINFYVWPYFLLKNEESLIKKQKEQKKQALKQIVLQKQIEEEIENDIKAELEEKIKQKLQ